MELLAALVSILAAVAVFALAIFAAFKLRQFGSFFKYREFVFRPLEIGDLKRRTRFHFERFTPDFDRLGFKKVGDFLLFDGPPQALVRALVSPDGRTFGTIEEWDLLMSSLRACTCASVCDDGMFIESANRTVPLAQLEPAIDRLHFAGFPGATVEELYKNHCQVVAEYEQANGCTAMSLPADQYQQLATYGHRLVGHSTYRQGLRKTPPPPVDAEAFAPRETTAAAT